MTAQRLQAVSAPQKPAIDERLIGAWKLMSCVMEDMETKEQKAVWGESPNGCLMLTATGHWLVIQTAQGRKAAVTDEDRIVAFRSMLAYGGRYRTEGRKITIDVDMAWDESWTGTEQVRFYDIEENKLHIEASPQRYANLGGQVMRGLLIWERVE